MYDDYYFGKVAAHAYWNELDSLLEGYEKIAQGFGGGPGPHVPKPSVWKGPKVESPGAGFKPFRPMGGGLPAPPTAPRISTPAATAAAAMKPSLGKPSTPGMKPPIPAAKPQTKPAPQPLTAAQKKKIFIPQPMKHAIR
jgi:hypothetical protein